MLSVKDNQKKKTLVVIFKLAFKLLAVEFDFLLWPSVVLSQKAVADSVGTLNEWTESNTETKPILNDFVPFF